MSSARRLGVDESPGGSARRRAALAEKVPLLALSIASSAVTVVAQHRGGAMYGLASAAVRVTNALVAYLRYLEKTVWPSGLSIFYPSPAAPRLGAARARSACAPRRGHRRGRSPWPRRLPWAPVGWFWFLGTLVPVIGLVQVGAQAMANRYMYLPMVGVLIALTWGAERLARGRVPARVTGLAAVTVLLALSAATWGELGYWSSHVTLFRRALALRSGQPRWFTGSSRRASAPRASRPKPSRMPARRCGSTPLPCRTGTTWGSSCERRGCSTKPVTHSCAQSPSIRRTPRRGWNLGRIELDAGRAAEAETALLQATRLSPREALAWHRLGLASTASGDVPEAIEAYREALRLRPDHLQSWNNLAVLYEATGRLAESREAFETAARLDPARPAVWRNLGIFFARHGDPVQAAGAFREALRLDPGNADVLRRLGQIYLATGNRDGALAVAGQLATSDPASAAESARR